MSRYVVEGTIGGMEWTEIDDTPINRSWPTSFQVVDRVTKRIESFVLAEDAFLRARELTKRNET